MNPAKMLFTRQQIAELTGVDDSTLNYWTREGVLRPSAGGGGKGQHRRFPYWEVNLAAILNEVRQFGANISSLKELASVFHESLDWADREGVSREDLRLIKMVQDNRGKFDRNGRLSVRSGDDPDIAWPKDAGGQIVLATWAEVADFMKRSEYYRSSATLKANFEDRHFEAAEFLSEANVEMHFSNIRYLLDVKDKPRGHPFPVFFYRTAEGHWRVTGIARADTARSYIAVDLDRLTFEIWNGK